MPSINTYGIQRLVSNLSPDELIQWEDEDGLAVPPANMRDAADDAESVGDDTMTDDYGNGPNAGPQSAMDRYRDAVARKVGYESSKPQRDNYRPKGWQRALAAVANFGAGYVNAGGRTRVDPRAMDGLNESLLRPGYRRAMENWQDQGAGVNAGLQQAGAEMQMETAQQRAANEARRAAAYEEAQRKTGALADRRVKQIDESADEFHASPTGHKLWNRKGEIRDLEPPKSPGPVKETPEEARTRRKQEVADAASLTPEQKDAYVLTGKIPATKAAPKGGKGGAGKPRVGTPGQFNSVESKKTAALEKAERKFKDNKITLEELEAEKARIMDAYDRGVENLGGSVIPRGGGKPPAKPTGASGGPKVGDERTYNGGVYRFDGKQWVLK